MRKVKKILGFIAAMILGLLLGFVLGGMIGDDMIALYERGYSDAMVLLISLAVLYFAYFVEIIIHEAGHMVFALLTGYKFVSFRVLSFVLVKDGDGFHLKRYRLPGTLGQCLMDPPEMADGKYPGMLYHMGGVIMNLISCAVFGGLWYVLAWKYWMAGVTVMFMAAMAVWGLYSALANGIPMNRNMFSNDGYNALKMRGNPDVNRALWIQLKYAAESARGVSALDIPEEWFEMPTEAQMQNHHVTWIACARLDRLYAAQKIDEAAELVDYLINAPVVMNGLSRGLLNCEKMFLEAIGENSPEVIEGLRTKQQLSFMKRMKTALTVIRAEYAYALLVKRDEAMAAQARARFEKMGETYPYPAAYTSELKLLDLVDQRAKEHSVQ